MNESQKKNHYLLSFSICSLLSVLCILHVSQLITTSLSIFLFLFLYLKVKNNFSFHYFLFYSLILSLPFSFTPMFGDSFFSLFIFIQIIIIVQVLSPSKIYNNHFLTSILFFALLFIIVVYTQALNQHSSYEFQTIVKLLLFVLFIFSVSLKFSFTRKEVQNLIKLYLITGTVGALVVFIQFIAFKFMGLNFLGNQSVFGEMRIGFAGLFYDYSIASIYLSSLAFLIVFNLFQANTYFSRTIDLSLFLFFISTSILTSARAGIFSFIVMLFIVLLYLKKFKLFIISGILSIPLLQIFLYLYTINRGNNLFYDSGRYQNYLSSIDYIETNLLLGSSFLGYTEITGNMLPHNFILDFLAQYGLIFSVVLFLILFYFLKIAYKLAPSLFFILLLLIVGANFHTSFINSHYILFPIGLIVALKNKYESSPYHT